jgi:hypothetical protein
MRAKVVTLSLVLMMVLLPLAMQSGVAPPGLPSLSVTVEDVSDVVSDPVEYKHVRTTATVEVTNFPLGATVNVNASAETWVVEVSPTQFEVPSGTTSAHQETIDLDIRVPPRASAERPVQLKVFANTTTPLGLQYEDEAFTNITVKQFYNLRLNSNATMALDQGKNLTARMRITNTGNGQDNYTISLNNEATLGTKGITIEHDESVHEVGRDRTVSVVIEVKAATAADVGTTDALFTVKSVGDGSKTASWKLTITVEKGDDNGGNGGNGDNGDGEEQTGLTQNQLIGIAIVIIILILIVFFLARSASEVEAEDEDYVVGRDRDDAEDR